MRDDPDDQEPIAKALTINAANTGHSMGLQTTFNTLDRAAVEEFVRLRQQEHLHLDFKCVKGASLKSSDDLRNFARAVSGFANSDGGILVWGVDARPDAQGVDAAAEVKLIEGLPQFLSRLNNLSGEAATPNNLSGEAATPIVDGLQHKIIVFAENVGCAATLVPASAGGPHMAKLGENRYYKRSGSSFYMMEHFDLQDMFGRRHRPDISLRVSPIKIVELGDGKAEEIGFSMLNTGRAIGKHWGMFCEFNGDVSIAGVDFPLHNLSNLNNGRAIVSCSDDHSVLHPNGIWINCGLVRFRRAERRTLTVRAKVYCDGMQTKEATIELVPEPIAPDAQSPR